MDVDEAMVFPLELVRLLRNASDAYYSGGPLLIDDETYDAMVKRLRKIDPNNPYLHGPISPDTKAVICLTGRRDKYIEDRITRRGFIMTTMLSSTNSVLLIPDVTYRHEKKLAFAKMNGIKILIRQKFVEQYLS